MYRACIFAKESTKIGQIWLWQLLNENTATYRGSPSCTQFQHHSNRERGTVMYYHCLQQTQTCYHRWRRSYGPIHIDNPRSNLNLQVDNDDGVEGSSNALVSRETAISVKRVHRGLYRGPGLPRWRHRLDVPAIPTISNHPPPCDPALM